MSFLDNVKTKYETPGSSLGADFIRPALAECVLYRRETGWFRSSALRVWAGSIINVIENDNIKIEIIAYPEIDQTLYRSLKDTLSQEEKDQKLKEHREKILLKALTVESNSENHTKEVGKYIGELLSYLIATKKLEIKFVTLVDEEDWKIVDDDSEGALTHIKRGYFEFPCGTHLSFTGSANESLGGLMKQGEAFYVFDSRHDGYKLTAQDIKDDVDVTWNENKVGYRTHKISKKLLKEIKKIAPRNKPKKPVGLTPESNPAPEITADSETIAINQSILRKEINLRDHQRDVLDDWVKKSFKGIVEHATGSGKTITGIFAIKEFFDRGGTNVILIVPSNLLQDQWREEIEDIFTSDVRINSVGGSVKGNKWKKRVKMYTSPSSEKRIIIAVSASASNKDFYSKVNCGDHLMVLTDEVHRIGAPSFKDMHEYIKAKYVLGLSATYKRSNDFFGNERIKEFYGEPLKPAYGIKEAINDKHLTEYTYSVHKVFLSESETEDWIEKSKEIRKLYASFKSNKKKLQIPINLSRALIERKRIAKKAENKINKALEIIKKHYVRNEDNDEVNPHRWLVYCEDKKQVEELRAKLKENQYHCSIYFSDKSPQELEAALYSFNKNGGILLSIKCLDEGVNIPAADHALILASSSSKREFIQRRGRVLRKDPNNPIKIANIHDILTLSLDKEDKSIKSLVTNEILRSIEFGQHAINSSSHQIRIEQILSEYKLEITDLEYSSEDDFEHDRSEDN